MVCHQITQTNIIMTMQIVEAMTYQNLQSELAQLQLGVGGIGCKDIQRKHSIEDEISWRQRWGYAEHTPKEIEDELWDKGEIKERYL